jgi:3-oxoacyl-[acyl-carrier protein] reductase
MKAIILGGSKGIGKAVRLQLEKICDDIVYTSTKEVDTSKLDTVKKFTREHASCDVLVLNTGGPKALPFDEITEETWLKYFNQLFLSFVLILKNIQVNPGGYVFLISSHVIKEPENKLILSNSLRLGFASVFKTLSKLNMDKMISYINIAPGPMNTDRLANLIKGSGRTIEEFAQKLPTKRIGDPDDIGKFVRSIVENKITSINGVTINFDMGLSHYIL